MEGNAFFTKKELETFIKRTIQEAMQDVLEEDVRNVCIAKEEERQKEYRSVKKMVFSLGIPENIAGARYICDAIEMYIKSGTTSMPITKEVYPDIAKKYGKTASQVERNIRFAIEKMEANGGRSRLEELVGYPISGSLTVSRFLAILYEIVIS